MVFAEHSQNLPNIGVVAPGPVTVDPGVPRAEVWGLPWRTDVPGGFPGLAYCIGGRSVFFGGWSPQLLDAEMPAPLWPPQVVQDLTSRYFHEAAVQIGVDETNDFVFGQMHNALRAMLDANLNQVLTAIPLAQLPPPPWPVSASGIEKLEAPLAVQGRPPRSGFFPMNKFSSVPLVIRATRQASFEFGGDDVRKRLMVIPNCHVTRLETALSQGAGRSLSFKRTRVRSLCRRVASWLSLPGPSRAHASHCSRLKVRLGYDLIGTNLVSHLRSNYRVPSTSGSIPRPGKPRPAGFGLVRKMPQQSPP